MNVEFVDVYNDDTISNFNCYNGSWCNQKLRCDNMAIDTDYYVNVKAKMEEKGIPIGLLPTVYVCDGEWLQLITVTTNE